MLRLLRNVSDDRAIRRVLGGDGEAFGILINRYGQAAFAVARAIAPRECDAQDVLQDALILAYRKLDTLEQPQRFGPWLISITRNVALRARERFRETIPLDDATAAALAVTPEVERAEMRGAVRAALERLDADAREILLLHYFAGASVNDMAEMLNLSTAAVKKRMQRARETLGTDLLKTLGRGPETESWTLGAARRKQLLGAVLAAGAAWQGKAHAATLSVAGAWAFSLAFKAVVAVGLAGAVATGALLVTGNSESAPTTTSAAGSAPGQESTPTLASAGDPSLDLAAANAVDAAEDAPLPTGPYTVGTTLKTLDGTPLAGAAVVLERVSWKANQAPPAKVDTWITYADDAGQVRIENLPAGEYSMIAYTQTMGGGAGFDVSERETEDISSQTLVYPIHEWRGQVVDAAGQPVKYAAIYPIAHESDMNDVFDHWQIAATRAISDEEGHFGFARMWPGNLRFYVYAEGYAPLTTSWTGTSQDGRFVLPKEGGLTVVLEREADGARLADTPLTLYERGSGSISPPLEGKTDAEGQFTREGLSPGEYQLVMKDAVLMLPEGSVATVEDGQHKTVTLRAVAGATVLGTVRNAEDNAPLPGLVVLAQGNTEREAVTAEDGSYMLVGVQPGNTTISVSGRAGDSRRSYPGGVDGFEDGEETHRTMYLEMGETKESVDFALKPAYQFAGVVLGVDGQPEADAKVIVQYKECTGSTRTTISTGSDGTGRFKLNLNKSCSYGLMASSAEGMSRLVPVGPAEEGKELVLKLEATLGVRLAGTAKLPDGTPMREGWVRLKYEDGVTLQGDILDGRVDFGHVPKGTAHYTIQFSQDDSFYRSCDTQQAPLTIAQSRDDVAFSCGEAGDLRIAGVVLLPDGKPAVGAKLTTVDGLHTSTTDAQGRFAFEDLAEGNHSASVDMRGYRRVEWKNMEAGDTEVVVQLEPLLTLQGQVVDDETGQPVVARVVNMDIVNGFGHEKMVNTDEAGRFTLESIASEQLFLTTTAPGYAKNTWSGLSESVAEGQVLVIRLKRPAQLAGMVVNTDGQPVAGAEVMLSSSGLRTSSVSDGRFVMGDLEAGVELQLRVSHNTQGAKQLMVTPGAPGSDDLRIQLDLPTELDLYVTRGGAPLEQYQVWFNPVAQTMAYSPGTRDVQDKDGHFDIELVPGEWQIIINAAGAESRRDGSGLQAIRRVTLVSGEPARVEVDLEVGDARIEGTVTAADGSPLREAYVEVRTGEGDTLGSQLAQVSGGRFSIEELPAGRCTLTVRDIEGVSMTRIVTLAAGETTQVDFVVQGGASVNFVREGDAQGGCAVLLNSGSTPYTQTPFADPPTEDSNLYSAYLAQGLTSTRLEQVVPGEYWMSETTLSPQGRPQGEHRVRRVTIVPGENQILVGE